MPSMRMEAINRREIFWKKINERLLKINFDLLSTSQKINYRIFSRMVSERINDIKFKSFLMPINTDSGFHTGLIRIQRAMPFNTINDFIFCNHYFKFKRSFYSNFYSIWNLLFFHVYYKE